MRLTLRACVGLAEQIIEAACAWLVRNLSANVPLSVLRTQAPVILSSLWAAGFVASVVFQQHRAKQIRVLHAGSIARCV